MFVAAITKAELRRELRERRLSLSPEDQRLAARRLASRLARTRWFRVGRRIACYLPNDGEIDTNAVIARILRLRKRCYLPVLSRMNHDRLCFAEYKPGMKMRANRFGILEPAVPVRKLKRAQELDLILLPLVGFDAHGRRLGMGGGYYDRSLAFLRHRRYLRTPRLVGLAYEFQRVEKMPASPWDVPLTGIVTDENVYLSANP